MPGEIGSHWRKGKPIFVNLENMTLLEPRNGGTRIVFVGNEGDCAEVVEDSDLIATMEAVPTGVVPGR